MLREIIRCRGHENVRATHKSTLEFTKEDYLTPRGDCILCIEADKGINDLSEEFKRALKEGKRLLIRIKIADLIDEVLAEGSPRLILEHPYSMVVRKSDYIDGRTLAIKANKAARDIDRRIVELLKNPKTVAEIELIILD
ncbi:hypothetical protein, conserved [Thermococcus onnurineus NA1]|uniref:DUF371 domain-containing protein n=1 Tax=Thermococcus onnurineus (strain NA1) TaxID=523850 RepID=B6YXA4_THEON|nr:MULTISPECIES: DUF371 domain-containing protein [Thermococcus]ACJ16717.1 hypothetical protein, conserved [Thermococcus onnurineus NA1]NJE46929.1 DUF371 domain-containing protein [Thermococcus sp. GR7]NJE78426.1 DUF371 domain-containing protein [Thermococcus sp. GR4]NJF23277.1 DUF371 domain-containing protein [Thermococcus sp. GR5]